jgi:hypothetical protein
MLNNNRYLPQQQYIKVINKLPTNEEEHDDDNDDTTKFLTRDHENIEEPVIINNKGKDNDNNALSIPVLVTAITRTRSDKLRESAQEQLDKIREQARKSEQKRNATMHSLATQTTPKPSPRATPQATPQATPRPSQEATPLNLLLHPSPRYMEPTTSLSPGSAAAVTRARTSGIQEHTGVLTRNLRREVGEAHTELKSNIPKSKHKQYVSGYNSRRYDDKKGKTKPLVPVYNLEHKFNKGYFRKELENNKLRTQLSSRSNPFDGTDDSISERAATSRNRSTMLSQTLTPETHVRKRKPVTRNV